MIGNLRVFLTRERDERAWFAQGLELAYAAEGETKEKAIEAFAQGLMATLEENLKSEKQLIWLLGTADPSIWQDFLAEAADTNITCLKLVGHVQFPPQVPFDGISIYCRKKERCSSCGEKMEEAGSCFHCPNCGATAGCS